MADFIGLKGIRRPRGMVGDRRGSTRGGSNFLDDLLGRLRAFRGQRGPGAKARDLRAAAPQKELDAMVADENVTDAELDVARAQNFVATPSQISAAELTRSVRRHPIIRKLGKKKLPGRRRLQVAMKRTLTDLAKKGNTNARAALFGAQVSGRVPVVGAGARTKLLRRLA